MFDGFTFFWYHYSFFAYGSTKFTHQKKISMISFHSFFCDFLPPMWRGKRYRQTSNIICSKLFNWPRKKLIIQCYCLWLLYSMRIAQLNHASNVNKPFTKFLHACTQLLLYNSNRYTTTLIHHSVASKVTYFCYPIKICQWNYILHKD